MKQYPFYGTFTEIIDYGFRLYMDHFKTFIIISFYAYMPFYLFLFASDVYSVMNNIPIGTGCYTTLFTLLATQNPLIWIGEGLIIYFSGLYIMGKPEFVSGWKETIRQVFWKIAAFKILLILIMTGLTVASILILPIVLLIYFSITLSMGLPIIMLEGKTAMESLNRSVQITKPHFAKVAAVIFLTGVLISIPQMAFNTGLVGAQMDHPWVLLAFRAITSLITILVIPVKLTIMTFLFFDIKHKSEGVDLFLATEDLEKSCNFTPEDKNEILQKMKRIKITKDMLGSEGSADNIQDGEIYSIDQQQEDQFNSGDKLLITRDMLGQIKETTEKTSNG